MFVSTRNLNELEFAFSINEFGNFHLLSIPMTCLAEARETPRVQLARVCKRNCVSLATCNLNNKGRQRSHNSGRGLIHKAFVDLSKLSHATIAPRINLPIIYGYVVSVTERNSEHGLSYRTQPPCAGHHTPLFEWQPFRRSERTVAHWRTSSGHERTCDRAVHGILRPRCTRRCHLSYLQNTETVVSF